MASYSTFWLGQPAGRCTLVASPSTTTASPDAAISVSHWRRSSRLVMKVPSGWQYPSVASLGSSRFMLSPTSVLEMPTMRAARRSDSPSRTTAATASRRTSNASGRLPPCPGGRGGARSARRWASEDDLHEPMPASHRGLGGGIVAVMPPRPEPAPGPPVTRVQLNRWPYRSPSEELPSNLWMTLDGTCPLRVGLPGLGDEDGRRLLVRVRSGRRHGRTAPPPADRRPGPAEAGRTGRS